MKWLLKQFVKHVYSGNSWVLILIIMIISLVCLAIFGLTRNIVGDWAFETIVPIPKKYQDIQVVREWFSATRGFRYMERGEHIHDLFKKVEHPRQIEISCLFSGWAFIHTFQHFMIAFLCPKLVYFSFVYGIAWELIESINSSHCTLDIVWNMCGCILGLLVRALVFPTP